MAGALLQRRGDFRRRSSLDVKVVPPDLDRSEVSRPSTVSPTSVRLPSVSSSQTPRQPGELRYPRPPASPRPCEASPRTTVSRRPSKTPAQLNQSRSPRQPASPPPATADYKQVFIRAGSKARPRMMSLDLNTRNNDAQDPIRSPRYSVARPGAEAALASTEASMVSTDFRIGNSQNMSESLQGLAWKQRMPRRATTEGRFYATTSQQFSPSVEKNPSSEKKVSAVRIEACRLLHFCFSGETRPLGEKGWDMKSCHRDMRSVKNQLDILDELLDRLTWKLSNMPYEVGQFVKEGRQSSCHYSMEHFVNEAMQKLRGRFRRLPSETSFPYWEDWAFATYNGSEDEFLSRFCHKITLQISNGKTSFTRDDIIRLLFPYASSGEIETVKELCPLQTQRLLRLPAPPVTDPTEYHDLCRVFEGMDDKNVGEISFEVVAENGFFDPDQMDRIRQLWDIDGNGLMSKLEFCQMMCKSGFRATEDSPVATLFDGRRVLRDPDDGTWYLEEQGGLGGSTENSLPAAAADQSSEIPFDLIAMGG